MPENVTICYRGASYELGRAPGYYGIWPIGTSHSQPLEWWPETSEGWYSAWSRFATMEAPGTIAAVAGQRVAEAGVPRRVLNAAVLVGIGVICGIVGLFPDYLGGTSLASHPEELVPHVIYLCAWGASGLLMAFGASRWKMGALLGAGTSLVTFGFFLADAGTVIAGGAHLIGGGLVLGLVGWLACALGSTVALATRSEDSKPDRRHIELFPLIAMTLCATGVAVAFAPSWDSYTLQTATGSTDSITAGNVFSNPAPIIAGNVAVMVALVAVVVVAALWRPVVHGALLLAGAVIPMVAQAISALIQVGQAATPAMFGISSATASSTGLTITSGLTLAFWIYCIFVVLLVVAAISAFAAPGPATARAVSDPSFLGPVSPQSQPSTGPAWPERSGDSPGDAFPGQGPGSGDGAPL